MISFVRKLNKPQQKYYFYVSYFCNYVYLHHICVYICMDLCKPISLEASYHHITSTLHLLINLLNPLSFQSLYKENGALSTSHCSADFPLS